MQNNARQRARINIMEVKMKKNLLKILLLVLCLTLAIGLFACDSDETGGGEGEGEGTGNGGGQNDSEIVLVENNVAKFQFVLATGVSGDDRSTVTNLIAQLRKLGVQISDPVSHTDAGKVADCEIIIGTDVKNRDEKYVISKYDLGDEGYVVRAVDNKVLVAGGSEKMTGNAIKYLIEQLFGITKRTESFENFKLEKNFEYLKETQYLIKSIKIGEREISDYTLIVDLTNSANFSMDYIEKFRSKLYEKAGYWLASSNTANAGKYNNKFVIRLVEDAGEDGFRAYATENDFIIECAYANAFNTAFTKVIDKLIFTKTGDIVIPANYNETEVVSSVKYSQFGAKGDGKTEDWEAIYNTHVYANQCGQKVYGDKGYTYYIWNFSQTIEIKTDTDFNGATFLINDVGDNVYANRSKNLFTIARDSDEVVINADEIQEKFSNAKLLTTDNNVKWLADAGYLTGEWNMIRFTNDHKDFIRHGSNINNGDDRTDIVIADSNGNLHADTPAIFDFKAEDQLMNNGLQYKWYRASAGERHNFTKIEIFRVDDEPITVENGYFERTVCKTVAATSFDNKYHAYFRAFYINRSNAVIQNIKHRLVDEPIIAGKGVDKDGKYKQSYPYYGFFLFTNSYNTTVQDCDLTGHTTYYEAKTTQAAPVPMGSYDFVIEYSSHITMKNVIQNNGVESVIGDNHYWGIMSSNGSKNMTFDNCKISRFDAHRGFWNTTIKDTFIGHSINVIGGGELLLDNVTKFTGRDFIYLRGDYGASFRGNITIKDCTLVGRKTYDNDFKETQDAFLEPNETATVIYAGFFTATGDHKGHYSPSDAAAFPYLKWDFGYTCYMPENIVVDNFKVGEKCNAGSVCLFPSLGNNAFVKPLDFIVEGEEYHMIQHTNKDGYSYNVRTDIAESDIYYNQYQITKSITYKNMQPLLMCPAQLLADADKDYYSQVLAIPVKVE